VEGIRLSVRYIGKMQVNGLREVNGVRLLAGSADNSYADIDEADLVIASGTFAYMAIARGKPTIMLNQDTPSRDLVNNQIATASRYAEYRDYMRYPFDVDDSKDIEDVMQAALETEPAEWKQRFIGKQLRGRDFVPLLEELMTRYRR